MVSGSVSGKGKNMFFHFFGTHYIVPNNSLSTNPPFETGVAKIQQGVVYEEMMNL